MPNQHALLSPSSSERWLHCPRSARLCEDMADTTSSYASEGTEAHALCEHLLLQALGRNTTDPRPLFKQYSAEMQEAAEGYVQYVMEQVADFRAQGIEPAVYVEQRLDLRAFIPDCMGTSDAIVVGGDTMIVVDFKFGCQPVPASSPQLRIYSLGVCELLSCLYDFTRVRTVIYQPRLSTVDEAEITKDARDAKATTASSVFSMNVSRDVLFGVGYSANTSVLPGSFVNGSVYSFLLVVSDGIETASAMCVVDRAFANLHLAGLSTGGVAIGNFSAATQGKPLFECAFPIVLSGSKTYGPESSMPSNPVEGQLYFVVD